MKKINLFAVAFVAVFTQSVIVNAAMTNRGDSYYDKMKSEAMSNVIIGADRGLGSTKGGIFVYASGAKAERGSFRGAYPAVMSSDVAAMGIAKDGLFVYASEAKAERGKCRSAYPAIMGTDVAAMGIAKEAYPPMQRGAKRGVEYPQTERGKC